MIYNQDKKTCCGCTACLAVCPVSCIAMTDDEEGFAYPSITESECLDCGQCETVCPALNQKRNSQEPSVYACYNKDEEIRRTSSSGGIFWLLVEQTIAKQGVVFGAKFDANFDVLHGWAETLEQASAFRGSKYAQSHMGDCFRATKNFLDSGRQVLFSGTPCQIAGLVKFLGEEYANLFTCDVICHGAPSPKVFQIYKQQLEEKYHGKITQFEFRNKLQGWENFYNVVVVGGGDKSGQRLASSFRDNVYMQGFLHDIYLRPSCYQCFAKDFRSGSDMTLGDFWGVTRVHPNFKDDRGTSLILCNSSKGEATFAAMKDKLLAESSRLEYAIRYNPPLVRSVVLHPQRGFFFAQAKEAGCDLESVVQKCIQSEYTPWRRLKIIAKGITKMILPESTIKAMQKTKQ